MVVREFTGLSLALAALAGACARSPAASQSSPTHDASAASSPIARPAPNATLSAHVSPGAVEFVDSDTSRPSWRWRTVRAADASTECTLGDGALKSQSSCPALEHRCGRATLSEWYESRPDGVELGYTISNSFGDRGEKIELDLSLVHGARSARIGSAGRQATLVDSEGRPIALVTGLLVRDARGVTLPSTFSAIPGGLRISIDAREATYPLEVDPLITPVQTILPKPSTGSLGFGAAIALTTNTAAVGANLEFGGPASDLPQVGAAYIFTRSGSSPWVAGDRLVPPVAVSGAYFGSAVALSGDTLLVSAPSEPVGLSDAGTAPREGVVYVFVRNTSTGAWSLQQRLAAAGLVDAQAFGQSVAVHGDVAVIGCNTGPVVDGCATVWNRVGTTWTQETKNLENVGYAGSGTGTPNAGGAFGSSVAYDGTRALVGAPYMSPYGGVAIYERAGINHWTLATVLTPPADYAVFGEAVVVSGNLAAIHATSTSDAGPGQGAVLVYARDATSGNWTLRDTLHPEDPEADRYFGNRLAIDGDVIVAGDMHQSHGTTSEAGAAYIFTRATPTAPFTKLARLDEPVPSTNDNYGASTAVTGTTIWVGSPIGNAGSSLGAVFDYVIPGDAGGDSDAAVEAGSDGATDAATDVAPDVVPDVPSSADASGAGAVATSGLIGCRVDSDCATGHCAGGVCCDTACKDKCSSCILAASPGHCIPEPFGYDLNHECGTTDCTQTCNGSGGCAPVVPGSQCAPLHCADATHSVGAAFCPSVGARCPTAASLTTDCAPYGCFAPSGACLTRCVSSADCASGNICDVASGTCARAASTGSGGCAAAGGPSGDPSGVGALVAVGGAVLCSRSRRRRRRKSIAQA